MAVKWLNDPCVACSQTPKNGWRVGMLTASKARLSTQQFYTQEAMHYLKYLTPPGPGGVNLTTESIFCWLRKNRAWTFLLNPLLINHFYHRNTLHWNFFKKLFFMSLLLLWGLGTEGPGGSIWPRCNFLLYSPTFRLHITSNDMPLPLPTSPPPSPPLPTPFLAPLPTQKSIFCTIETVLDGIFENNFYL